MTVAIAAAQVAVAGKQGAGNIDGKFGNRGKVLTPITSPAAVPIPMDSGGPETHVIALGVQPSGKLIAMGFHNDFGNQYYALARYSPDGVLDTTFGSGGTVVLPAGNGTPAGMAIQSTGRIVLAGGLDTSTSGCQADFLLQRLTVDGAIDASFGTGGQVLTDFGACDSANAVTLGASDSIVAAGWTSTGFGGVAVAKYDANGNPDNAFGDAGRATAPDLGSGQSVVVQPSGRVVVGANFEGDFRLFGFTSGGVLDATFADAGWNSTYFGDNDSGMLAAVALRGGGGIVAVGGNHDYDVGQFNVAIAGYDANGDLDATFGTGGLVQTHVSANFGEDQAGGVAVQPDGSIVVGGWSCDANCDFVLLRYLANGAVDGGFGRKGVVLTDFQNGSGDLARPVFLQGDKIVQGGWSDALGDEAFALARYKG
jgi:uncharacterized delta-60 repeat protein